MSRTITVASLQSGSKGEKNSACAQQQTTYNAKSRGLKAT